MTDGRDRRFGEAGDQPDRRHPEGHHRHDHHLRRGRRDATPDEPGHAGRGRHGRRHGGRLFDYGELRLLVLTLIAERPRHGYELIKEIEERLGGSYTPSPGVIYPTLAWLEDMGYVAQAVEEGGRKRYSITAEGEAFLLANRAAGEALLARVGRAGKDGRGGVPAPVLRAMENLKLALRLRLRRGSLDAAAAQAVATALDAAATAVERT